MSALAFARRSGRILSQVRLLRSHPALVTRLPPVKESESRRRPPANEEETIIFGKLVDNSEFNDISKPKKYDPLTDPKVLTLVQKKEDQLDPTQNEELEIREGYTDDELSRFDQIEEIKLDDALCDFKKSQFDADFLDSVGPGLAITYNVAALADKHEVIKQLIDLNVPVHKWDAKPEIFRRMVKLDWRKDCTPRIEFLVKNCGFDADGLSRVLSRNPLLLTEELQHLEARLEFMRDKKEGLGIKKNDINRVLHLEPLWLSTSIESLEIRIKFFQSQFDLAKHEFRTLIVSRPQIVTTQLRNLALKKFTMVEEMGFTQCEIRKVITRAPKILTISRHAFIERYEILHLEMGFENSCIASNPRAFYCRASRLRERAAFLKFLGRDQFDNLKPGFINPLMVATGSDEQFLETAAKSTKEAYETFIKTL